MSIKFSEKGKEKFAMYDYIDDIIEGTPKGTETGESSTSSGYHLFNINDKNP